MRESFESIFQAYGEPLDTVTLFKYLGRVLTAEDDNWPALSSNLRKSRKIWMWMTRILVREGADPRISRLFFKAVVKDVLLFGSETWVMTPHMERDMGRFQNRVSRRLLVHQGGRKESQTSGGGGDAGEF